MITVTTDQFIRPRLSLPGVLPSGTLAGVPHAHLALLAALVALVGCTSPAAPPATGRAAQAVVAAANAFFVPDPGPPPHEAPPLGTLWIDRRAVARVQAVAPGARAWVDAQGTLVVDGRAVADHVLPDLAAGPDGAIAFTRSPLPPLSDVWLLVPGAAPKAITADGHSDRPVVLPDGTLRWISSAGTGLVGWFGPAGRLTNAPGAPFTPVPAFPAHTRVLPDGAVLYDAGEAWWIFDATTGQARPK